MAIFSLLLDLSLVGLLIAGIVYAVRLTQQLAVLRAGQQEMARFVAEFNGTVMRAEVSMKGFKQAARSAGDDLEVLIEKSQKIADELHFLIESADGLATRLSASVPPAKPIVAAPSVEKPAPVAANQQKTPSPSPSSTAEKDLLKALEMLG